MNRPRTAAWRTTLAMAVLALALLFGAQSAPAQDVIISSPTTINTPYIVNGNLSLVTAGLSGGSLSVTGFLDVANSITNSGLAAGIGVTGNLVAGGNVFNDVGRAFVVQGIGFSSIGGTLTNDGTATFGNNFNAAQLSLGALGNTAGATLQFLPNSILLVTGPINNAGNVTFQLADFTTQTGTTFNNSGTWNLTGGSYTNQGTASNAVNGVIGLSSGDFDNRGLITNNGQINLANGSYDNYATTNNNGSILLARGNFQNQAGATLTNQGTITLNNGQYVNWGTTNNQIGGNINLTAGDFQNQVGGTLTNRGTITLSNGQYVNRGTTNNQSGGNVNLTVGDIQNQAGGTLTNSGTVTLSNGQYINLGTTNNNIGGAIRLAAGDFQNQAGGTLNNQGTIAVGNGQYLNQGTTNNNNIGGAIGVAVGDFQNLAGGTLNNQGTIVLGNGQYVNWGTTNNQGGGNVNLMAGDFQNQAGGTLTNGGTIALSSGQYDNLGTTNNQGTITLSNGQYVNQGATNNQIGSAISLAAGDFQNQASGTLTNQGSITLSNGQYVNQGTTNNQGGSVNLAAGDFQNLASGTLTNSGTITLSNGQYVNQGTTNNQSGSINLAAGDFQNLASGTLTNSGTLTLSNGNFLNQSTTNNQNGGNISLWAGDFQNQAGATLTNNGTIVLIKGDFDGLGGSTTTGSGLLRVNGTVGFEAGSMLQGSPKITASSLILAGTVSPGTPGSPGIPATPGTMTFNAPTIFEGEADLKLGNPGVASDQFQIVGGNTETVTSGAQFKFTLPSTPPVCGNSYKIIDGNIAVNTRPVTSDNDPNYRIVLRTDQDITSFNAQGTAYYALVAWNPPFEQLANSGGGTGHEIAFGRYLDKNLPQDDHTFGTANAQLQWIRDTLDLMPTEASVAQALGQMTGEIYAPLAAVALQRQFFAYDHIAERLRRVPPQPCETDQPKDQGECPADPSPFDTCIESWAPRGWVTGYGFGGSIASDPNADSCSYGGGGVLAAFGYQVTDQLDFGFFFDFGAFRVQNDFNEKADSEAYSFGGYTTWRRDCDYFMFVGGGGFSNYRVIRPIDLENQDNAIGATAQSATNGGQAAFYGEYGRNIPWKDANFRPYVGALYMVVQQNACQETGAGNFDLSLDGSAVHSFRTVLGGQLDFRGAGMSTFLWSLRAVWMHECVNEATTETVTAGLAALPNSSFSLARPATGADWGVLGCGVRGTLFSRHFQPFANCDLVRGDRQSLYAGTGGVEYAW